MIHKTKRLIQRAVLLWKRRHGRPTRQDRMTRVMLRRFTQIWGQAMFKLAQQELKILSGDKGTARISWRRLDD